MRIQQTKLSDNVAYWALRKLQSTTLPGDDIVDPTSGYWWLCLDDANPIGFIGMKHTESWPTAGYIERCGVLESHRGKKLQQRMLRAVERKALKLGLTDLISTTYDNPPSANSFIACGYKSYEPITRWGAVGTVYWHKVLA